MFASIAVIVKDEEKSIGKVLSDIIEIIRRTGQELGCEIFLIDGYSTDNTIEIARGIGGNIFSVKGGKGRGIRKAIEVAKGEYVLFIDADGSHVPEDILRLLSAIKSSQSDLVIISRILGHSEELGMKNPDTLLRAAGNKLSTSIINLRWGKKLTDIQNGFRIIKRSVAMELELQENGFAIEQEMVMKCLKKNKKIMEISGIELKRQYGKSKVNKSREFWKYLWSILRNL